MTLLPQRQRVAVATYALNGPGTSSSSSSSSSSRRHVAECVQRSSRSGSRSARSVTTTVRRRGGEAQRVNAISLEEETLETLEETYSYSEDEVREMGFTKVGDPVPYGIPLSDVLNSIPKKAFEKDNTKAYKSLAITLFACAAVEAVIAVVPLWLLPVAWVVAGTAFTGLFVIGHDCGHRSFHTSKLVEDVIGNALMSILIYPYEGWRFKHGQHHAKTNMLVEDTAWHPVVVEELEEMHPFIRASTQVILGTPIKFFASILYWLKWHFNLNLYKKSEKKRVLTSIVCCAAFTLVGLPVLFKYTGWFGLVKHWVMPWLGFHFWLSAFTLVHHTSPHIPFKSSEEWDPVQAQLGGTVHCVYPKWVEVLCHDINVHVPHHLSPRIPHYRLRMAYEGIKEKYGNYVNEATFNWKLVNMLVNKPHVYNKVKNYISFKETELSTDSTG